MKEIITYSEYLQLVGLKKISDNLKERIDDVEKAIADIIGEKKNGGYYDWSSDITYSGYTIDYFLSEQVKIKVEKI